MKKDERLDSDVFHKIHATIGAASMCWTNTKGAGEFRSELASEVAQELCDFINRRMIKKPKTFWEMAKFTLKSTLKGLIIYSFWYFFHATLLYFALLLWFPLKYWQVFGIFITLRMIKVGFIDLKTDIHHKKQKDGSKHKKP